MGMKNKILYSAIAALMAKGRRDPRWLKIVVGSAAAITLFFVLSFGFLLYFAFGLAKDLMAAKPDLDLLAMERLIATKALVLSPEQQSRLTPIIADLTASGLAPEQAQALKAQLLSTLAPAQLEALQQWQATAIAKSSGIFALPPALAATIEQYTGLSKEVVMAKIDAFLAWWQLAKPANSAEQLQQTMRKN